MEENYFTSDCLFNLIVTADKSVNLAREHAKKVNTERKGC